MSEDEEIVLRGPNLTVRAIGVAVSSSRPLLQQCKHRHGKRRFSKEKKTID